MQITRSSLDTQKGPGDWFTGMSDLTAPVAADVPCAEPAAFTAVSTTRIACPTSAEPSV